MSTLEVLQSYPSQRKSLLSAIGSIDPADSDLITFDLGGLTPRLPQQITFLIQVVVNSKTIHHTVIDEGASTCIMFVACWKAIGSPALSQSPTTLEAFDGRVSHPIGILQRFPITLEQKTVEVEVEVVGANLTYNLLLGCSWMYAMQAVASSLFRIIRFPHQGKIVTVDQLAFFASSSEGNIPFVEHTSKSYENLGAGLFKDPSLMGVFLLPPPNIASINMIIVRPDPWVLPPTDQVESWGDEMLLSPAELNYVEIVAASAPSPKPAPSRKVPDSYAPFPWLGDEAFSDPLKEIFPSDEAIIETMSLEEPPWRDHHHRSSFLPAHSDMLTCLVRFAPCLPLQPLQAPIQLYQVSSEGNLGNITQTQPIDISMKPGIVEHIQIGVTCTPEEIQLYTNLFREFRDVFAWSYDEMPGIDPSIVEHEIPTYPGAKPVHQRLHPVHPRKAAAIKAEVEKLLKAGFIYPIPLTDWVSNIVPVTKKQGTIRACVDYRDINRACPKDNFSTPFIDQLIDECAGSEMYSFMDGFSGYNQINIAPADQHKTAFICPWGTFAYKKLPFGLKNASATFQRVMSYAFHDIRHIVQPYLDDLPAHSAKRQDHLVHLRDIFLRYQHYHIRLNPHKCVFCVESGRLLGFIVSRWHPLGSS